MTVQDTHSPLEVKTAAPGVLADAFEDFMRAFEAFKDSNDERLGQIEKRSGADGVTLDKLERINAALDEHKRTVDEMVLRQARPERGIGVPRAGIALQHKAAFESYVRKGDPGALRQLEEKALSVGSSPDGGYLVPAETERSIMLKMRDISPIRAIAGIRQVSASVYKKPFSTTGFGAGWVGETASRPQTTNTALAELSFPTMELYAMPAATPALLDDAAVNIDEWIAEEIQAVFAEQESNAFVVGDGVNKPRGFLDYPKIDNGSWTWGNLGYLVTGVSGAFAASNPSDKLVDLIYTLKAGYRANAHWVMKRSVQAEIRKLKATDGNYIWQPAASPQGSPTLMGFPVAEAEDMPSIAANSYSIAFGDFSRGYLVVDRVGLRVLRDPYSAKPYVLFYTTKRVGGGIQDFDAIKLMKFGTV